MAALQFLKPDGKHLFPQIIWLFKGWLKIFAGPHTDLNQIRFFSCYLYYFNPLRRKYRRETLKTECSGAIWYHNPYDAGYLLDRCICSRTYQRPIKMMGLRCSMGRRATYYDNAAMESFFIPWKWSRTIENGISPDNRQKGRYSNTSRCTITAKENIRLLAIKLQYSLSINVLNRVSRDMPDDHLPVNNEKLRN